MKKMIMLLACLSLIACTEDDNRVEQEISIYGIWQVVESFSHPPTGNGWTSVEDGFIIEFRANNSFTSTEFSLCQTGTFTQKNGKISFEFDCEGFTAGYEEPAGIFSYNYSVNDSTIELAPTNFSCFEGCSIRLNKLDEVQSGE